MKLEPQNEKEEEFEGSKYFHHSTDLEDESIKRILQLQGNKNISMVNDDIIILEW